MSYYARATGGGIPGDLKENAGNRFGLPLRFKQLEILSLYGLGFFLPLGETPMHIFFILLCIGALGRRIAERGRFWRLPDPVEYLLLIMGGIAFVSTLVNWPLLLGVRALRIALTLLVLFWIMYRSPVEEYQIKRFLTTLIAAVMAGLLWGLWRWHSGLLPALELPSAGVVTQASIYLGVVIFLMMGIVLDTESGFSKKFCLLTGSCLLFSWFCLILMGSRGGLLAVCVGSMLLGSLFVRNRRFCYALGIIILLGVILVAGARNAGKGFFAVERVKHLFSLNLGQDQPEKMSNEELINAGDLIRVENWKIGYAQVVQGGHFWLGVGPRNYGAVKINSLYFEKPLVAYPVAFNRVEHAHNLFLTKWVEEGLLGLLAFLSLLGLIAWKLIMYYPRQGRIHWFWVACLGALTVPVVAGSFNSPFYNEFAWLSMMITGYSMGRMRDLDQGAMPSQS